MRFQRNQYSCKRHISGGFTLAPVSYLHRWNTWRGSGSPALGPPPPCTLRDISGSGLGRKSGRRPPGPGGELLEREKKTRWMCWICALIRNELLLRCYADVELNETMHYETTASLLKAPNLWFFLPFMWQTMSSTLARLLAENTSWDAYGCILTIKEQPC